MSICVAMDIGGMMLTFTALHPISGSANMALGFAVLGLILLNTMFLIGVVCTAKDSKVGLLMFVFIGFFSVFGVCGALSKVTDGDLEIENTRYKDGLALTTNATIEKSWTACDRVYIPEVAGQRLVKIENDNGEYALSDCKIVNANELQITINKKQNAAEQILRSIILSELKSQTLSITELLQMDAGKTAASH